MHIRVILSHDAKEAIAFAVFANETVHGNPSNIPSVTGAEKECILGENLPII